MKPLRLTDSLKEQVINDFIKFIDEGGYKNGDIKYTKNYKYDPKKNNSKVLLKISHQALLKMRALVEARKTEVGWNFTVERIEELPEEYNAGFHIKDVLVFPQIVNGSHFEQTEDEAYQAWSWGLTDTQYNEKKGYGHSHVNMTASPSGGDESFYEGILANTTDFAIFMITNKRAEDWWRICDVENNLIYTKEDIEVVQECEFDMQEFLEDADAKIDPMPVVTVYKTKGYPKGGYYDDELRKG